MYRVLKSMDNSFYKQFNKIVRCLRIVGKPIFALKFNSS